MRLESLYRARFTTPESWSVQLGGEGQSFLIAEGRCKGRVTGRYRGANYPRKRSDGTQTPAFRGALETDDGATILFAWNGYGRAADKAPRQLVGSMTHVSDDERYVWMNDAVCAVAGEVRPGESGGLEVVLDVLELVWEPLPE